ncbi:MAG: DUF1569 domain-containing protein [bacterium]
MKTMHSEKDRRAIAERVRALDENRKPVWGRFTAPRMVAHLSDAIRMATGELGVARRKSVMRYPPLKQFIIYLAPFPKGVPTAPELLARAPLSFESEVEDLVRQLKRFAARDPKGKWPAHPIFGTMSGGDWGTLAYRHCDHHLRQFGA